jgi:hypothetical protein
MSVGRRNVDSAVARWAGQVDIGTKIKQQRDTRLVAHLGCHHERRLHLVVPPVEAPTDMLREVMDSLFLVLLCRQMQRSVAVKVERYLILVMALVDKKNAN